MVWIIFGIIFIIAAVLCLKYIPATVTIDKGYQKERQESVPLFRYLGCAICVVLALLCFFATSFVYIGQDEVGHKKRIYLAEAMNPGQIIAAPWQKGAQAELIMPGFHIIPFLNFLYKVEKEPIVEVPEGSYGFVTTKDGMPLEEGQYLAREWDGTIKEFTDAEYFLGFDKGKKEYKGPRGQMGPQLTVLRPGKYRINRYLYNIGAGPATDIPAGFVGVVKSNEGADYAGESILPAGVEKTDLSVPIVPRGYRGVWKDVYEPGRYYINEKAYKVTKIDTRVQVWKYLGGYTRRWIDLKIGDDGKIEQSDRHDDVKMPPNAADKAIVLRVEGWDVFQDSRVQVQVTPENAPFVVAAVGDLQAVEDKIITPNYRSILRNVVAQDITLTEPVLDKKGNPVLIDGKPKMHTITRPRKVLDLLYHREMLETAVAHKLIPQGRKTGLTVQWVRFGDPAVPPELLVPGKRKQLAQQLKLTYKQEQEAQIARVNTERERARADQQPELMRSEIGIQVATNKATAREKLGIGEKKYMEAVAKGQKAQADVLGEEKTFELAYIKEVLAAAKDNPDMIKIPQILVMGDGGGLEGAAAILGASNLNMGLKKTTSSLPKK